MDAISSLPDSIIDSILAYLPLGEAVRTSILSREWRYKWTSIPQLVFDCLIDGISNREISQVLHQHHGPLNKFFLNCIDSPDIDQWIPLLKSSQVHDFTLRIFEGDKHVIPSHFFSFQNLKHLCLYNCIFKPPPEFKGFSKLATLDFEDVDYVPSIFEQLISQCPLLESLRLVRCTEFDAFEIQGPSLRSFRFCGVFNTVRFKKSPVLADVSLSISVVQNLGPVFKQFQIPTTVEKLHFDALVLALLDAGSLPSRPAYCFYSLKYLSVSMYLDNINEVASAFCLARSSPTLQTLRVTLHAHINEQPVIEFMRAQETPDRYLRQLKRVEIARFKGFRAEIEFLRYLLASAAGLEKMVITPSLCTLSSDTIIMNQLNSLPRASPTVLVFYMTRGGGVPSRFDCLKYLIVFQCI